MRNSKAIAVICALLLAVTLAISGCGSKSQTADEAPLVKTQQAGAGTLTNDNTYSGTVRGRYETNMSFQVGGQIIARNVQVGTPVRSGDVLMVIDAKDVVQQVNQGDAQVESAKAQLNLAQSNLKRYTELYQQDAIAAATLDQYQTNYDAAFSAYQNALAQAAQSHNALGYTNLTAGANGVISSIQAEEGQVVAAGQTVLTLVQTNELEIEIDVPENHVDDIAVGMPATVSFWALSTQANGVVREIAPMADSTSRTYRVRVSVPNPPDGMQLGMTASVSFSGNAGGDGQTAVLPLAAIYQDEDKPQVWVVDTSDNTVHKKEVQVTNFGDNQVLVTGLQANDLIVTAGVHKLQEGETVRTEADDS